MDEFEELDALYDEHFGLDRATQVSEAVSGEQVENVIDTETEWTEEDTERQITNQERLERCMTENEETACSEGRDETENEVGTDQESDDGDIGVRCRCKTGNCLNQFRREYIDNHIMSVREMEKDEKEMYIMGTLQTVGGENTRGGKRKRVRYGYSFEGKRVCRRTYRHIFDIGNRTLRNIMNHISKNGRVPRVHGNKGRKPAHTLQYEDARYCVDFLVAYADLHGVPMPAAPRGRDEEAPVYLPASETKEDIHRKYTDACSGLGRKSMKLTSFKATWGQCVPHIKISSPRDDVCHRCEIIRKKIMDAVAEEVKLEASHELQTHIQIAQTERQTYKDSIERAKEELQGYIRTEGPVPALSTDFRAVHYTFDYSQLVSLPHHYRQMGPLYFVSGRKIQLFGIRIDGVPLQFNYLIDEDNSIGPDGTNTHGPDSVISMLHDCLFRHGYGEKACVMHADNCAGQNKNQFVIAYLAWRVFQHLHDEITLLMQVPGHTRCLIDAGFAHIKKLYRRSDVDSLEQMEVLVNKSAYSNNAVTYMGRNGEPNWTWYNWKAFLKQYFIPLRGIQKYHQFRFTKEDVGAVFVSEKSGGEERRVCILRNRVNIPEDSLPTPVQAAGLSAARARYLYTTVRPLVRTQFQDVTCPRVNEE